jgi:peptidoglycan/xylan/chitin deacetylase (PgdA/CDA1 family)
LLRLLLVFRRKILGQPKWTIITYHNIIELSEKRRADIQPGMCVLSSSFDKQMGYISRHFDVVSVETIVNAIRDGKEISLNPIAVTFDDGWRDNYTVAFPILHKYKIPAMIFLATDLVKSGKIPPFLEISMLLGKKDIWPDKAIKIFRDIIVKYNLTDIIPQVKEDRFRLLAQDPYQYMQALMLLDYKYMHEMVAVMIEELNIDKTEWENYRWMVNEAEIREMAAAGIEFGSHGESHDLMVLIKLDQVSRELKHSKEYIEALLGKKINILAYPNGDFNEAIKKEVQAVGYQGAMAMNREERADNVDRFSLRRLGFSEGTCLGPLGGFSKTIFACKIARVL